MILIAGATGILGGMIARHLLDAGHSVRILARPHSEFGSLQDAGAQVAFGDLKDPASLTAAMEGVEVVVTTANSAMRGGEDNVQTVELEGNRNLIDAARQASVKQFVFTSALGATLDNPELFLRAKAMSEAYLRASGMPYTILAPNVFMEGWIGMIVGMPLQTGQPVTLVGEGRRRHAFVSIEDVAAFAIAVIDNPAALNQYVPIAGPVAVSWNEIVESCGRVLGRDLPVNRIAPGESLPGLPEQVSELMAAFETYDSDIDVSEVARSYGVTLTPFDSFVRRTFGASAANP